MLDHVSYDAYEISCGLGDACVLSCAIFYDVLSFSCALVLDYDEWFPLRYQLRSSEKRGMQWDVEVLPSHLMGWQPSVLMVEF